MPWISRAEHDRLLAAIDAADQRALAAESALAAERAENRRTERWMANMLLRRAGTFPVPPKEQRLGPPVPVEIERPNDDSEVPGMDPGEIEALVATGADYGQSRVDVIAFLRKERGIE